MTVEAVLKRVKEIADMAGDNEAAHSSEDKLYRTVLLWVAENAGGHPAALCRAALKSREIEFDRWMA